MITFLLLILAIAGFSAFSFGNVERAIESVFPKLSGGQVRWIGLTVGFVAAWVGIHFIVALLAAGGAIYFRVRR